MDGKLGTKPTLDQVILTAGSNELLHVIGDSLLDPGDIVLTETADYFVFLGMLRNLGDRSLGVATDEHGLIPEALEETFQRLQNSHSCRGSKHFTSPAISTIRRASRWRPSARPQIVSICEEVFCNGAIFYSGGHGVSRAAVCRRRRAQFA